MAKAKSTRGLAVITGASSGIGEAYALRLARDGYDVALVARRKSLLDTLAKKIEKDHGVTAEVITADLVDPASLAKVEEFVASRDSLELMINNAGLGTAVPFAESDIDRIEMEIRLNVIALVRLTRAALKVMAKRGTGSIINVSSLAGFQPNPYVASYGATKAYVNSFTEAIAMELRDTKIRLLAVCPGPVKTEFGAVAGVREESTPQFTYIPPETVVDESLDALAAGKVIMVPGTMARLTYGVTSLMPRPVVRRVTYEIGKRFFK